jgi:AraC family transcriptional regulator
VCGEQDEVVNQIGLSVLSEMMTPTAAGRMFAETASLLLAARLLHAHWDAGSVRLPIERRHRLDERRLRRVLDYVEEHLADDIAVADLANVTSLSIFYFTRAFSAAVGMPPHRYVSQRRLEWAKTMIAAGAHRLQKWSSCADFPRNRALFETLRVTQMSPRYVRYARNAVGARSRDYRAEQSSFLGICFWPFILRQHAPIVHPLLARPRPTPQPLPRERFRSLADIVAKVLLG